MLGEGGKEEGEWRLRHGGWRGRVHTPLSSLLCGSEFMYRTLLADQLPPNTSQTVNWSEHNSETINSNHWNYS